MISAAVAVLGAGVWSAVYFIKSRSNEAQLLGAWKSDADATIAEMRKTRPVTDKQEEELRKIFGRMTITYSSNSLTTQMDGVVETAAYEIVSKDRDFALIKVHSPQSKKEVQYSVQFADRDTYWVETGEMRVRECFRRVK
jgi:hypothetical protein